MLAIENLAGGYGETNILNGINLSVAKGEIVTVAGTNGAGKSTLAKALVGLLPRVTGRILLADRDMSEVPAERRALSGISYVPQTANVFRTLNVVENLEVVEGVADRKRRLSEMLDMFPALAERRWFPAGSLSGGERQQLAFARALMTRPDVIVLDEPTAALSPIMAEESFQRIAELGRTGTSILLIEQRARQALAISDRGAIMDAGKVALEGPADFLLNDPRAAELYLGGAD